MIRNICIGVFLISIFSWSVLGKTYINNVTVSSCPSTTVKPQIKINRNEDSDIGESYYPEYPERYLPMPIPDGRGSSGTCASVNRPVSHDMLSDETIIHDNGFQCVLGTYRSRGSSPPDYHDTSSEDLSGVHNFTDLSIIDDPDLYPWCVNVKLFMQFGSSYYVGSGVLIDPYHVLTAGHCVFDHGGTNDWADNIVVAPAYENGTRPYGDATAVGLHSWTGWTSDGDFDHDMGVIDLDRPVGAVTGWHGYGYNNNNSFFTGNTFHNPGYPAESPYDGQYMYYWYGDYDIAGTYQLTFFKTAYGGQSGSGSYNVDGDQRTVYAVLSNGWSLWTNDVRITETKYSHIGSFIEEDTPTTYDLIALDVNHTPSSINAGNPINSMNYLVHNYSSASWSGTIPVTVYLSTNNNISTADTPLQTHSFTWSFDPISSVRVTVSTPPTIPIDTSTGGYYIGIILDAADNNPGNNESDGQEASYIWVIGGPDLMIENPSVSPVPVIAGEQTTASCSIRNQGGETAGSSIIHYYLSQDTNYDASDTFLGYDTIGSLPGGDLTGISESVTIPAATTGGTWYALFLADASDLVSELNEDNNILSYGFSVLPEETKPDAITDLSAESSDSNVLLSWTTPYDNVGVTGYYIFEYLTVHDIGTLLYFIPDGYIVSYTIPGGCGDPDTNHFYDVRARDAAGNIADPSNLAGEFDFSCGP